MPKSKTPADMPAQPVMCSTCPWRKGSPYAYLQDYLGKSALTESNRICHSTGTSAVYPKGTGKPERVCRAARDLQLGMFVAMGFLDEPTDEAWIAKVKELRAKGVEI